MIRYIGSDNALMQALEEYTDKSSVYACRIACLLRSYGTGYDFAGFYLGLDDSGNATSAAVKYYSDMTVMASPDCDTEELAGFICMTSPSSVLCPPELGDIVPRNYTRKRCTVMRRSLNEGGGNGEYMLPAHLNGKFSLRDDFSLREIWELICSCGRDGLDVPAYEDFLPDMSHKLRHGTASLTALYSGGQCAGAAMTTAQSVSCAVIGAVAVSGEFRRQGIGSACVESLCGRLAYGGIGDAYVMREQDRNREFYRSLGFADCGEALVCTVK